jgi:hypothetical protein
MKKPKKPVRKQDGEIILHDYEYEFHGNTVGGVIAILSEMDQNAKFVDNSSWGNNNFNIRSVETNEAFNSRMEAYRKEMLEWKKWRAAQLLAEVEKGMV